MRELDAPSLPSATHALLLDGLHMTGLSCVGSFPMALVAIQCQALDA